MIKKQNFKPQKLKAELDDKITEVQLEQLERDIRECANALAREFSDEIYTRFQTLKNEQRALLELKDL